MKRIKEGYENSVVEMLSLVKLSGGLISDEWKDERKKICDGCDKNGVVTVAPGVQRSGCEACGCPFETKRVMSDILGRRIVCDHPEEGNKWKEIDDKFFNLKSQ